MVLTKIQWKLFKKGNALIRLEYSYHSEFEAEKFRFSSTTSSNASYVGIKTLSINASYVGIETNVGNHFLDHIFPHRLRVGNKIKTIAGLYDSHIGLGN